MNDETWIRELAQAAKDEAKAERAELEGPWDSLTDGHLTAPEVEELQRRAKTSPEAQEAYEAFRPLGPEFKARMLAAAREKLKDAPQAVVVSSPPPEPVPLPDLLHFERPTSPKRTVPQGWARRWGGWAAATAAAAACLTFFIHPPGSFPPLPSYDPDLVGGVVTHRGEEERSVNEVWTFRQGAQLDLALRPSTAVEGKVAARCVLLRGQEIRSCDEGVRQIGGGVIQIVGTVGEDLRLEPGEWTLCASVGRPRGMPSGKAVCGEPGGDRPPAQGWQSWKFNLRIE